MERIPSIKHDQFVRGFCTKSIHAGQEVDTDTGAIVPPIHVSSTYEVHAEGPQVCLTLVQTLEIHIWKTRQSDKNGV